MIICLVRNSKQRMLCPLHFAHIRPGAMVLAHSLRDNGTEKQLAVLVNMDTLQPSAIDELKVAVDRTGEGEGTDWSS